MNNINIIDEEGDSNDSNESLEQQALKLRFVQELIEASEKINKDLGLPKKNNETSSESTKDKAAIRLYSKEKINELKKILENPPDKTASREELNKYYYNRKMWYLINSEPVQIAKKEKEERLHPRLLVAVEDMFDVCMLVHKNVGCQGMIMSCIYVFFIIITDYELRYIQYVKRSGQVLL
jgi:hypothetical protein